MISDLWEKKKVLLVGMKTDFKNRMIKTEIESLMVSLRHLKISVKSKYS